MHSAIGGSFAKPTESFPAVFPPDSLFGAFPYLLPNLICALLLLISIIAGYLFLVETHPEMCPRVECAEHDEENDDDEIGAPLAAVATAGSTAHAGADLRAKSYGTFNNVNMHEDEEWNVQEDGKLLPSTKPGVFTYRVTMLVVALGIFTYHSMTYDHLLPIFLQDEKGHASIAGHSFLKIPGGLGMTTQTVGLIMSFNGIIALFIQAVVFPIFAEWLGVWNVFVMVTILHPIAYFIVPFLAVLPPSLLYTGIYTCLTVRNFFSILAYPVLLILIKQASPASSVLGKINGLAASAGAACRTVAPPVAGYLYTLGSEIEFTGLAWWGSAVVAVLGALQLFFMREKKHTTVSVNAPGCFNRFAGEQSPEDIVHVHVHDAS